MHFVYPRELLFLLHRTFPSLMLRQRANIVINVNCENYWMLEYGTMLENMDRVRKHCPLQMFCK